MTARGWVGVVLLASLGCHRGDTPPSGEAGPTPAGSESPRSSDVRTPLARAEDLRRAKEVPASSRSSRSVLERRHAARALARIADDVAAPQLLEMLLDDDPEVVSWAAYGLGYACKGREEVHVKALVARAASLPPDPKAGSTVPVASSETLGLRAVFSPRVALARAIGRCGSQLAEDVLLGWLKAEHMYSAPAALGLGDLGVRRKSLRPETVTALAAAAARPGMDSVFHALARVVPQATEAPLVMSAARAALAKPGDARILAIKTLAKLGKDTAADLAGVATSANGFTGAERAEAARGLGLLGDAGHEAAGDALVKLVPDRDPAFLDALVGPLYGVIATLVESLGEEPPKRAEAVLGVLSRLAVSAGSPDHPTRERRIREIRCAAALGLARGAHEAESLVTCAPAGSEPQERARLRALLRRPLVGPRKAAFLALARSTHLRVRELAVEGLARHAELGDSARDVLADALSEEKGGLVATAADAVLAHPERLLVLSAKEKRAALDPRAPPPTANPEKELDPKVAKALEAAMARVWPEDRYETKLSLLDAAVALSIPSAKKAAIEACTDGNVTVRERAQKALKSLGEARACDKSDKATLAPEVGTSVPVVTVTLVLPTGELALRLEPELSPVTVARITSLARAGFYKGIVVHRVVPGFVLQLGDPDGDGYGGSGKPLRCETSPAPFLPGDVGMALAGRDTGSSQLFVTLARTPHLDGEYARIGHAEGAFEKVAEGDVVTDVKVTGN